MIKNKIQTILFSVMLVYELYYDNVPGAEGANGGGEKGDQDCHRDPHRPPAAAAAGQGVE